MDVKPVSSALPVADTPVEPASHSTPVVATVGGKTYIANVNYSAGEYVAQDPAVFGAEGSGPNPQAAEEAFRNRIDFLA